MLSWFSEVKWKPQWGKHNTWCTECFFEKKKEKKRVCYMVAYTFWISHWLSEEPCSPECTMTCQVTCMRILTNTQSTKGLLQKNILLLLQHAVNAVGNILYRHNNNIIITQEVPPQSPSVVLCRSVVDSHCPFTFITFHFCLIFVFCFVLSTKKQNWIRAEVQFTKSKRVKKPI